MKHAIRLTAVLMVTAAAVGGGLKMTKSAGIVSREDARGRSLYSITASSINGAPVSLSEYQGKVTLVVNTASNCGFTSQYEALENLHRELQPRGFAVLGFPSNDFAGQEPGTNEEIAHFCKLNYGVTFPLFEKAHVTGQDKQPVFRILSEESAAQLQGDPGWNFVKFLVDKRGILRARFSSMTDPDGKRLRAAIEELLAEPA